MKKYLLLIKRVTLFSLIILGLVIIYYFFYYNQQYYEDTIEQQINFMYTIIYFILFFYLLSFLINTNIFYKIFLTIIILGIPLWIVIYLLELLDLASTFWNWYTIRDLTTIFCFSLLSPGLSLGFIKYIRNHSNKNKKKKFFQNYHIHEGFVGILFIIIAIFLWILRYIMMQYKILRTKLRIFVAIDMVLLFLFLFSGSFLIFRDRRDLIRFKFIEKRNTSYSTNISLVFYPIDLESIKFFKSPRLLLYPIGILISSLSVNLFIHGTDFLPKMIFNINHEILVLIGFILCPIGGGMLGIDWYRLFAKLYPDLYQELERTFTDLKK